MPPLTCQFTKSATATGAPSWPSSPGLPVILQPQTAILSGTVTVPTHAFVPVPYGALASNAAIGVWENGVRIPAQVEIVQTWDGSTPRWLHVHFLGKYDNGVARSYYLLNQTATDIVPSTSLIVTDGVSTITVENGYIKFIISKTAYAGIQELWYDSTGLGSYGSPVYNSILDGPTYIDEYGGTWRPQFNTPCYEDGLRAYLNILDKVAVTIEQSGHVKVTITAKGFYQPQASYTPSHAQTGPNNQIPVVVMAFTSRITLYAGLPWIMFQHANTPTAYWNTQIWTNITTKNSADNYFNHPISAIKYSIPIPGATSYAIGVDGSTISGSLSSVAPALVEGMSAFWKFDTTSWTDEVYQNTLIATGGVTNPSGHLGNAAHFDGTGYLSLRHNAGIDLGSLGFAISGWAKLDTLSVDGPIFSKWNSTPGLNDSSNQAQRSCRIYFDSAAVAFKFDINTSTTLTSAITTLSVNAADLGSSISTATWYHFTGQWDAGTGTMTFVVSGHKKTTALSGVPANSPISPLVFGASYSDGYGGYPNFLTGSVDAWGIWLGRTLSDSDISTLFNSGTGVNYPFGLSLSPTRYANPNVVYEHQYRYANTRLLGAASGQDTGTLAKSDGWAEISKTGLHALLVSKNPWQQFPKELELSQNGLTYHQWPAHSYSTYSIDELTDPANINKLWNMSHGPYWDSQIPAELIIAMQVGPCRVCTFATGNAAASIVTTTKSHGWLSGQSVRFMPGNGTAIFPTTSPQLLYNHFLFNELDDSSNYPSTEGPYYIQVLSPTTFKVFTDSGLTSQVTFSGAGSGTLFVGTCEYQNEATYIENYPPSLMQTGSGVSGASFNNEFALIFSATGTGNNAGYQKLFQQHPIATPSAAWCAASGCFGPMAGIGSNFSNIETALKKAMVGYFNFDRALDYGQFNYGDTHHEWYSDEQRASLHRCPLNSHYFAVEQLWSNFFRSGDTDLLNLARLTTDHYISVDTLRTFTFGSNAPSVSSGQTIFGFVHCKGISHWGGDTTGWNVHYGDSDGTLFSWLIDANRWAKQAFDDFVNQTYIQAYQNIDLQAQLDVISGEGGSAVFRDYIAPLKRLLVAYEHTHDARLLPAIFILAAAARSQPLSSINETGPLWHPRWLTKYYENTNDPNYIPFIKAAVLNFGVQAEETTIPIRAKMVELGQLAPSELIPHLQYLSNYVNTIANLPATPYDGFGQAPGALTDGYNWLCWPYLLKQVNAFGITSVDPTTAIDYHGQYIASISQDVYIQKTNSTNWAFNLANYSLGGDISDMGISVYGPMTSPGGTTPLLFKCGDESTRNAYYQPQAETGTPFNATINTTTGVITTSGGPQNNGVNTWTTGQFVVFESIDNVDSHVTLPTASVPFALHTLYYARILTATTLKLYSTATDAINNTNQITFTAGSNNKLAITTRGIFPYQPVFVSNTNSGGVTLGVFTVIGDAGSGIYRLNIASGKPSPTVMPLTNFPEAQLVAHGVYNTTRLVGYILPVQTYPITIVIQPAPNNTGVGITNEGPVNVLITDSNNAIVANVSLLLGQTASNVTVYLNNNDGHTAPWLVSIIGVTAQISISATNGQSDTNMLLLGDNAVNLQTIKSGLGL